MNERQKGFHVVTPSASVYARLSAAPFHRQPDVGHQGMFCPSINVCGGAAGAAATVSASTDGASSEKPS